MSNTSGAISYTHGELSANSYQEITVWPLVAGSTHSNLQFIVADALSQPFDHLRFRKETTVNTASYSRPTTDITQAERHSGTFLYGGVIFHAFGHFIAESIHRLWPLYSSSEFENCPIVFHSTKSRLLDKRNFPDWMTQIFNILQIDIERLILVDRPIRFENLVVPIQGSQIGYGPITPEYTNIFPPARRPAGTLKAHSSRLYVSRSKFVHGGSYLGEPLVERTLKESAGFEIVHPEDHPIADVIDILENSEMAVFSEGSAIHFLELCRSPPKKVFVIARRGKAAWKSYFEGMVSRKARVVGYHGVRESLIPLDWSSRKDAPAGQNACAVVDVRSLLNNLAAFCHIKIPQPDEEDIRRAQALSLLHYLMHPQSTRNGLSPETNGQLFMDLKNQVLRLDILPTSFAFPESHSMSEPDVGQNDDIPSDQKRARRKRLARKAGPANGHLPERL